MELFKILGTIAVNNSEANSSIESTTSKASALGSKFQSVGSNISKVGATITKGVVAAGAAAVGATAALTKFATDAASAADNVDKMSQKIGISRQAYQELDFICSQSGTSVDTLQAGMKTLTAAMDKAAGGTKANVEQFEALGISVTDANGQLRSQEDVMWETLSALQGMENQTEKARLATQLFGKSGTELMPMLNGASGSIDGMKKQAHDLGLVMSDESIDAGVKFTDTMDQLKRSFAAASLSIGQEVMPYLQKFAEYIIAHMPEIRAVIGKVANAFSGVAAAVGKVINWFMSLDGKTQKMIITIGVVIAVLGPVITAIGGIISVVGTLIPVVSGCAAAFGALNIAIFPIIAIVAAVVAVGVLLYKNWDTIKEKAGQLKDAVANGWNKMKEGIANSKLGQAAGKAFDEMKSATSRKLDIIKQAYEEHGGGIKGIMAGAMAGMKDTVKTGMTVLDNLTGGKLSSLKDKFSEGFGKIGNTCKNVFGGMKNYASETWDDMKVSFEEGGGGLSGITEAAFDTINNVTRSGFDVLSKFTGKNLDGVKEKFTNTWFNIRNKVVDVFYNLQDKIKGGMEKIKGFFNFKWELPKIKMPHFKISGKFSINPPSVPKFGIEWYRKAMNNPMIMNSPTAFGINSNGQIMAGGEAGSEIVSGTDTLMNMIASAVAAQNQQMETVLSRILELLAQYMPQVASMQLVMDTGATVGALAPGMDVALGRLAARSERGVR